MKNITILVVTLLMLATPGYGQQLTQTIRGSVIDIDTNEPLIGAEVYVLEIQPTIGTVTDIDGNFELINVPVGRRTLSCQYVGYSIYTRDNIQLNSAKEYYLEIKLKSGVEMETVVVKAYDRNTTVNDIVVSSTRRLDPEELQYHAATANDPSRLVMGFPGVQPSRDTRSDIVIRGNSSVGLLWRLEGIDIPNPNHFARKGSSGGGITIFSASMLGSSDFSVGAFPAEYGNSFSGVFDMNFREGNKRNRETSFRAGILGLDIATEGPIKKDQSSYLANFRYSTLGILNSAGIHLVGPRTDNSFYDLSFKVHHKNKNTQWSLWGIGGKSTETFRPEDGEWKTFSDAYTYEFTTDMGAVGTSLKHLIDNKSYLQANLAVMGQQINWQDDSLNVEQIRTTINKEKYVNNRVSLSTFYKRTFSPKLNLKVGAFLSRIMYNFNQQRLLDLETTLQTLIDGQGSTNLIQPYVQFSYRPTNALTINFGAHSLFFTLNNTSAVEPRLNMKYQINNSTSVAASLGIHSRIVPLGSYFTIVDGEYPNMDLDLILARHAVLAFEKSFGKDMRFHAEFYYQTLRNVPISPDPDSKYWLLNDIIGYAQEGLISEGKGQNIGIDMTIEKFFSQGAFFVLSGSAFNSTYQIPNDPTRYNTQYDGRFSGTFTGGNTWKLNDNTSIEGGLKMIFNGGNPIRPIAAGYESKDGLDPVWDNTRGYIDRVTYYFRPDLRIALRKNMKKSAYWLALDIQNFINRRNVDFLDHEFDSEVGRWVNRKQGPLTPIITFQLDF